MPNANADDTNGFDGFTRSDLNAFRVTSVLAGALLMVIVSAILPRLVAHQLELPQAVWKGLGFLALGVSLFPLMRMEARLAQPPRVLTWQRWVTGCVIGSLLGGLVFTLLETVWPT